MYYYKIFGLIIASDMEFRQLQISESCKADIVIREGDIPEELSDTYAAHGHKVGKDVSWLSNTYCYLYIHQGKTITYKVKDQGKRERVGSYIMGWGMSMLGHQRGFSAMHCSVIATDAGAVLISGESGSGKSTLTNCFLNMGWSFMADDMAYVNTQENGLVKVCPAFPYQKLCRDAALKQGYDLDELIYIDEDKDKFYVPYEGVFAQHEMQVKALFVLRCANQDTVTVTELSGLDKFMACANNLFLRHILGNEKYVSDVGKECFCMSQGIRVFVLTRPAKGDSLQEVMQKAVETAQKVMNE